MPRKKYGVSFSWKRALGISAAKGKLSRKIGIPLTKSGRQKKAGKAMGCLLPLLLLLLASFLVFHVFAQEQDQPLPDRWRGLVIDQSTPEDAIKTLGKPSKDKLGSLMVYGVQRHVSKKQKEKVFRNLEFKKLGDVQKAILSFLDDKLVMIWLDVKSGTIAPNALSNIYGLEFQPIIGAMDLAFNPRHYERNQGRVYPKTYPTVYHLAAASETSIVSAMISNVPSFLGALGKSMGMPDEPSSFPGKVEFVQIISRKLENTDGAEVLK